MKSIAFSLHCVLLMTLPLFAQVNGKKPVMIVGLPRSNPFATASRLPYHAPLFDKIHDDDYKPALEAGLRAQLREIEQIANNSAPSTFANTLVAMEKSGQLLTRVKYVFSLVTGANTNPVLQKLEEDIAPKLAGNQDVIYLNIKLFRRIEKIYQQRSAQTDPESKRLIEYYYKAFVLAGAKLSVSDKTIMKKLNGEEATLSAQYTNQLLNSAKSGAVLITDSSELAGLSRDDMGAFAQNAKSKGLAGKWLIPLQNTTQQPVLQSLSVRATRQKIYEASWSRAEKGDSNDTRAIIIRLASIRAQKARLMGFASYAAWKLQDQMAQTPDAVTRFFAQLVPSVTAKVKAEAADIQALIDQQNGGFALQPWDWYYYGEQVRKAKYNIDENEIKPYFELKKVLENGVFYAANLLYGLTFKERKDLPVYAPDVRVFEVFDQNKKPLALFYCDYYKRDNKSGGAWMSNLVDQTKLLGTKPVIYNICNFTKPATGQPSLISFDDVTTMFHEFGHGLHGIFANQKYPTLSGTNVARDFVEFPSQFNEHWALHPSVLKHYAVHFKTGKPISQELIKKIKNAGSFNTGYRLTEAIAAASVDMQWHKLSAKEQVDSATQFEKDALHAAGMDLPQVPPRYHSPYFLHIWSNGYAAGYYAYQWTKMLEEDAYAWFEENGGLTRNNGQRFRDMILSKGNTEDYNKMFSSFRGHSADIKSMQQAMGLDGK